MSKKIVAIGGGENGRISSSGEKKHMKHLRLIKR